MPFTLLGVGAGLSFLPLTTIAMAEVPLGDAGLASGIVNASLQISAAIGIAALGTVAAERTKVLAGLGQHPLQALTGGFHLAWALAAGAVAVGALITLLWLRRPPAAAAAAAAARPRPRRYRCGRRNRRASIWRQRDGVDNTGSAPAPSLDRSRRRRPLRLGISRQVARGRDGHDEYVTQVRFGNRSAVLMPRNRGSEAPPEPS